MKPQDVFSWFAPAAVTTLLSFAALWLHPIDARAELPRATASGGEAPHWDHARLSIPDTPVVDQDGKSHRFYSDLVKGRTVAINFVFTTCSSVCPPLTAVFRSTQQELADRVGPEITLISISVDPLNDTPAKLKQFASKFDPGPGWLFLTGKKSDIDRLLAALGAFSGARDDHSPLVLIGNDAASRWTRLHGLAQPSVLVATLREATRMRAEAQAAVNESAGFFRTAATQASAGGQSAAPANANARYFTNLPLLTQDNRSVRFYDDLINGHIVVIHAMFTGCTSVCLPVTSNLQRVQASLGDTLGRQVRFISITVDPLNDSPEVLKKYAERHHVDPSWVFLTGKRENVDWVLYKLGAFTDDKQDHSTALYIGNDATGEWVKLVAMSEPAVIVKAVRRLAASSRS